MPRPGVFSKRSIPQVAKRLGISVTDLYRAVNEGEVKVLTWAATRYIMPAEEERLRLMLTELHDSVRGSPEEEPEKPIKLVKN